MMVLALVLASLTQKSIYDRVVTRPDPNNGYEDYLRAADVVNGDDVQLYTRWRADRPASARGPAQELAGMDYLQVMSATAERYGRALDLIRTGNGKRAWNPRQPPKWDDAYPEFRPSIELTLVARAAAYRDFAHGNSAAGTADLLDGLTCARRGGLIMSVYAMFSLERILNEALAASLPRLSDEDAKKLITYSDSELAQPSGFLDAARRGRDEHMGEVDAEMADPATGPLKDTQYVQRTPLNNFLKTLSAQQRRSMGEDVKGSIDLAYQDFAQRLAKPESQWYAKSAPYLYADDAPVGSVDEAARILKAYFCPLDFSASALVERTQLRLLGLHGRIIDFHWRNNRLPKTLREAVGDLAKDPINGEEFVYEQGAEGTYRLYSTGFGEGRISLGTIEWDRAGGTPPPTSWATGASSR